MGLFGKSKSSSELKRDIAVLERKKAAEVKRQSLESERKELSSKYRELKYAKAYSAGRAVSRGALKAGGVGLTLAGNAARNLSTYDYSPGFVNDFGGGRRKTKSPFSRSSPSYPYGPL